MATVSSTNWIGPAGSGVDIPLEHVAFGQAWLAIWVDPAGGNRHELVVFEHNLFGKVADNRGHMAMYSREFGWIQIHQDDLICNFSIPA